MFNIPNQLRKKLSFARESTAEFVEQAWKHMPQKWRWRILRRLNDHFMVGVLALVLDENEHVLLLDHRFRVPWSWGLPGGFVRHGESLTVALRRELQEEMGLEVSVRPQPLDAELTISTHNVSITYVARILGAPIEVRPRDPREIRGGKFFEPGKLPEYIHPRHADIVRSYWRQTSAIV